MIRHDASIPSSASAEGRNVPSGVAKTRARPPDKRRACDFCRKRKTKCYTPEQARRPESGTNDTSSELDVRCVNCIAAGTQCTYENNTQPRTVPKAYVKDLEERQEKLEKLMMRLDPSMNLRELCGPKIVPGSWDNDATIVRQTTRKQKSQHTTSHGLLALRPSGASSPDLPPEPRRRSSTPQLKMDFTRLPTLPTATAAEIKRKLSHHPSSTASDRPDPNDKFVRWRDEEGGSSGDPMTSSDEEFREETGPLDYDDDGFQSDIGSGSRFHGKSSGLSLVRITRESRNVNAELSQVHLPSVNLLESHTWSLRATREPHYPWPPFPPNDLLHSLVDLYFKHINIIWPLLLRPIFEADLEALRHERDRGFACMVLAMCAAASRYCDDRRVLAKVRRGFVDSGDTTPESLLPWQGRNPWVDPLEQTFEFEETLYEDAPLCSSGWIYYTRCEHNQAGSLESVTLTELQTTFLMHQYLLGINDVSAGWVMVGAAIRKAQDQGLHRKKVYRKPSLESELRKRAFWCLVVADRIGGAIYGRPCSSRDEDSDVDLPLSIDDDCWVRDETGFTVPLEQPAGKPSYMDAFDALVKLSLISVLASRTLYAIDESKAQLGLSGIGWEQSVVAGLNRALDEWVASVPPHLKWDDNQPDPIRRTQSANLHQTYHLLHMHIYRCFIPAPIRGPPTSLSSKDLPKRRGGVLSNHFSSHAPPLVSAIAICAYAARANARLLKRVLSYAPLDAKGQVQLSDAPTLLVGAGLTGVMLVTVIAAKQRPEYAPTGQSSHHDSDINDLRAGLVKLGTTKEETAEDYELLNVCIRLMEVLESRWLRAARGLNLLLSMVGPGYKPAPPQIIPVPSSAAEPPVSFSSQLRPPPPSSTSHTPAEMEHHRHSTQPVPYQQMPLMPHPPVHSMWRNDPVPLFLGTQPDARSASTFESTPAFTHETHPHIEHFSPETYTPPSRLPSAPSYRPPTLPSPHDTSLDLVAAESLTSQLPYPSIQPQCFPSNLLNGDETSISYGEGSYDSWRPSLASQDDQDFTGYAARLSTQELPIPSFPVDAQQQRHHPQTFPLRGVETDQVGGPYPEGYP